MNVQARSEWFQRAIGTVLLLLRMAMPASGANLPPPKRTITLSGRVLIEGKPTPNATVYLRESPTSWSQTDDGMRPSSTRNIAETTADAVGNFSFDNVKLPEARMGRDFAFPLDVIAVSATRGLAWRHIEAPPIERLELSLPDERKVAGRLTDREGRPLAAVRVRVREIAALSQPRRPNPESPRYLDLEYSDVPLAAVTDADGKFVLRGLPADIRATLIVDDPRYLRRETYFATTDERQGDLIEWPTSQEGGQPRAIPVHSWYAQIEVDRAYRLFGHVIFADTREPTAGAGFNDPLTFSPPVGVTGADGRFTLDRLAPGKFRLHITAPAASGYLGVDSTVDLAGDDYQVERTVELPRGELVHGRVLDASNGQGISGATIWPVPKPGRAQNPQPFADKVQSAADGRFAVAVAADTAELILIGPVRGYVTHDRSGPVTSAPPEFHRPIDVRAGQAHPEITFELRPRPNAGLRSQVVDANGEALEGVEIRYQGFGKDMGLPPVRTASEAKGGFVLEDLDPSFEYDLRVIDRLRGLGRFMRWTQLDQPKAPLTIELKPLAVARGRVIDEEGRPITGAVVRLYAWQGRHGRTDGEPVATDHDGRFEATQLLPDIGLSVKTSAEGYASRHDNQFTLAAGERHALGDIVLPRADQDLAGVLVDAEGEPIAGARVLAHSTFADQRYSARTETGLTDKEGRFQLHGLPRGDAVVWQSFDQFDNRKTRLGQVAAGTKDARFVAGNASK